MLIRTALCGLLELVTISAFADGMPAAGLTLEPHVLSTESVGPGLVGWSADLRNASGQTHRVEMMQNPGGYAGSGTFYPCRLERWDVKGRRWVTLRETRRTEFNSRKPIRKETVAPGQSSQVCAFGLPSREVATRTCLRFVVRLTWKRGGREIASSGFLSDGNFDPGACPHPGDN